MAEEIEMGIEGRPQRLAPPMQQFVPQALRTLVKDLFDPYHPERHYMRGPGPKWRAKHAYSAAASQPSA